MYRPITCIQSYRVSQCPAKYRASHSVQNCLADKGVEIQEL